MTDHPTVWWARPDEKRPSQQYRIKPLADYPLGELAPKVRGVEPFTDEDRPHSAFFNTPRKTKLEKDPADFMGINMGGFMVSEPMRDLLAGFDLGATQLIELPLYDGKEIENAVIGNEPDLSRRDPRRWFLLHVVALKDAFLPEASRHMYHAQKAKGSRPDLWEPNAANKPGTLVALDPSAAEGADLWRDSRMVGVLFFSDRLRRAIETSGLRAEVLKFRTCGLIEG